jgi:hypothetical protein
MGKDTATSGRIGRYRTGFGAMRRSAKADRQKPTLDRPAVYEIRVPGQLDESWAGWFGKVTVTVESHSEDPPVTTLTGTVDQAALHSLLRRLYSLGLPLISVTFVEQGGVRSEKASDVGQRG